MATWYLMNTIQLGTVKRYAGTLIDDVQVDTAPILAAGGKLEPSTRTGLSAASAIALAYVKRGNHKMAESIMNAALDSTQLSGFSVDATPGLVTYPKQDTYVALSAPGTNYVAQYAAGAPIDDVGPFVVPTFPRRTAQIVLGVGGAIAVDYTIDGTDVFGNAAQEVIAATGAGTYQGTIAWETITRFRSDIDPGGDTDLQVGDGFSLSAPLSAAVNHLAVDEIEEVAVSVDLLTSTVVPTTVPDGIVTFAVHYDAHVSVPAHTHTITF